jgi:hypothetical protein
MQKDKRKAAIAAYRERKVFAGIFAVRCNATGERWLGSAPNIGTIQTRIWFGLRLGTSPHRHLQAAWREYGPDFTFEQLEILPAEDDSYFRDGKLKDRLAYWCKTLDAPVLG